MSAALQLPPRRMTVPEFLEWSATVPGRWELRDGEPTLMNPPAVPHAALVGEIVGRLHTHLRTTGNRCRVYPGAGVSPRARADHNLLIPDVTVACDARNDRHAVHQPIALIEVLSPSNERDTRANVWAFTTIPSVVDILLVSSVDIGAELLTRDADGNWPERMLPIGAGDSVSLRSINWTLALRELYSGTHLDGS